MAQAVPALAARNLWSHIFKSLEILDISSNNFLRAIQAVMVIPPAVPNLKAYALLFDPVFCVGLAVMGLASGVYFCMNNKRVYCREK